MEEMVKYEMKEPILTIAIPTYNRERWLKSCLEHLCPQVTDEVRLVVRDNCSNYDVQAVVDKFRTICPIEFYRNRINIGGDANIARLFEYCDTQWLWVVGDDDDLVPDAVETVLNTIKENPDVIFINFGSRFSGKVKGIEGFAKAMEPFAAFGNSFFITNGIHNLKNGAEDLYYHYKYLSTCTGQIFRVICHLIKHPDDSCFFIEKELSILKSDQDMEGKNLWNAIDVRIVQSVMFEMFYDQRKLFNENIFRDFVRFSMKDIDISRLPLKQKNYYWRILICKAGLINVIRYNFIYIIRIVLRHLLPNTLFEKSKKIGRRIKRLD